MLSQLTILIQINPDTVNNATKSTNHQTAQQLTSYLITLSRMVSTTHLTPLTEQTSEQDQLMSTRTSSTEQWRLQSTLLSKPDLSTTKLNHMPSATMCYNEHNT